MSALRAPGRVVEALTLSAAAAAVATAQADRPLVVAAAMVAGYLGAARMLWPLRAELDVPTAPASCYARGPAVSCSST